MKNCGGHEHYKIGVLQCGNRKMHRFSQIHVVLKLGGKKWCSFFFLLQVDVSSFPRFKLTLKSGNVALRLWRLINMQAVKTEETEEILPFLNKVYRNVKIINSLRSFLHYRVCSVSMKISLGWTSPEEKQRFVQLEYPSVQRFLASKTRCCGEPG